MNKTLKVILNILIVVVCLGFLVSFIYLITSIRYKNRDVEDPVETYAGVFDYRLEHRAYGEVLTDYYVHRMSSLTAPEGYEDLYRVGEYAHTAFMSRVYEEKGDAERVSLCSEKMKSLRSQLGDYAYTADEVDEMIRKAP